MANPLLTNALDLAEHTASGIWKKNIKGGIIGSLTPDDPQIMVGATDFFTFTGTPKAELVGEGANKSSMDGTPAKKTSKTYKVQLTYRFSDEIRYVDEEYRLRVMEALAGNIATGVSRAVDLVAIHGINPLTGQSAQSVTDYIVKNGNGHVINSTSATPEVDLDAAAAALQGSGYVATGIALDPVYAGVLARTKKTNGDRVFPELGLGFNVDRIAGIQAAVSNTVSATAEKGGATGVGGIMADWSALKWGIARNVPLHLIEYGDPDGAGDLQRTNEVAIRAEVIFGFAILDDKAFAIIKQAQVSA